MEKNWEMRNKYKLSILLKWKQKNKTTQKTNKSGIQKNNPPWRQHYAGLP